MSISELFSPQKGYTDLDVNSITSPFVNAERSFTIQPISIGPTFLSTSSTDTLPASDIINGIYGKISNGDATVSLPTGAALDLAFADAPTPFQSFTFIVLSSGTGQVTFNLGAGTLLLPPGNGSQFIIAAGTKKYVTYSKTSILGWRVLVGSN